MTKTRKTLTQEACIPEQLHEPVTAKACAKVVVLSEFPKNGPNFVPTCSTNEFFLRLVQRVTDELDRLRKIFREQKVNDQKGECCRKAQIANQPKYCVSVQC